MQVRAVNDSGAGPWSASGSGRTEGQAGPRGSALLRLVGNLDEQPANRYHNLAINDRAQGFTTAPHTIGWVVTGVDVFLTQFAPRDVRVTLATGLSTSSAGTTVATLRNPATLGIGVNAFAAPAGTVLDPDSEYFVVVEAITGSVVLTNSNAEDGLSARDWYIADNGLYRAASATGAWTSQGSKLKISVSGRQAVGEPPGAPDAPTVSALTDSTGVSVSWFAPDHVGSGVTDYDLRYYAGSADPSDEADWIERPAAGARLDRVDHRRAEGEHRLPGAGARGEPRRPGPVVGVRLGHHEHADGRERRADPGKTRPGGPGLHRSHAG